MSKASYKIIKNQDRLFFHDGKRYVLIDTGFINPLTETYSISDDGMIGPFEVSRPPFDFLDRFINMTMDDGSKPRAVLNPLDGFNCLLEGDTITITDEDAECPEGKWFLEFTDPKLSVVEGSINGQKVRFFFDTGARMTTVGEAPHGSEPHRTYLEWLGQLMTHADLPVYDVTLEFPCGFRYQGEAALVTHDIYRTAARMMKIQAILGIDLFNHYDLFISARGSRRGLTLIERK